MGIQGGVIKAENIESGKISLPSQEIKVRVDKTFIQKAIMDKALFLMNQIDVSDIEDLDLTTTEIGDSFRIELSVDIKRP